VRLLARQALERIGGGRLRLRQRAASALGLLAKKGLDPWYAEKGSAEHRARLFTALQEDALLEGLRQAIPALNRGLEDPDPRARRAAIEVLESLGTVASPAVPRLIQALSDRDRFVRWAAARALGRIPTSDPGRVIPHLVRLLNDDDPDLRSVAAASLGRLEPSPQVAGGALLRQSPSHIGKDQTKEASNQRMPLW
jgi:HEAT repeat protein